MMIAVVTRRKSNYDCSYRSQLISNAVHLEYEALDHEAPAQSQEFVRECFSPIGITCQPPLKDHFGRNYKHKKTKGN